MSALWLVAFYGCLWFQASSQIAGIQIVLGKIVSKRNSDSRLESSTDSSNCLSHISEAHWGTTCPIRPVLKIRKVSTISSFSKFIGTFPVVWHMNIQVFSPVCQNMLWIIYNFRLKSCPFSFGNVCINTDFSISCCWNCILNILGSKSPQEAQDTNVYTYLVML